MLERYKKADAVMIDASKPLDAVVDEVIGEAEYEAVPFIPSTPKALMPGRQGRGA